MGNSELKSKNVQFPNDIVNKFYLMNEVVEDYSTTFLNMFSMYVSKTNTVDLINTIMIVRNFVGIYQI